MYHEYFVSYYAWVNLICYCLANLKGCISQNPWNADFIEQHGNCLVNCELSSHQNKPGNQEISAFGKQCTLFKLRF